MSEAQILPLLIAALAGLLIGAVVFHLIGQRRARAAADEANLRREPEIVALREQRESAERSAADFRAQAERLERERALAEQQVHSATGLAAERKVEIEQLARQLAETRHAHDEARERVLAVSRELSALQAGSREQAQAAADKLVLLERAEQRLRESFQNLAHQILDAKAERFREQNAEHLGGLLDPLKLQLKEFRETVTQTHALEQRERGMLAQQIHSLRELNQQISQDAINLTRALKGDSRTQGAWGELVLERLLETAGLQAGREYDTQTSLHGEDGGRQRPDVIVRLPDDKDIVIDAKVSLVAWERFVSAEDDALRLLALREHIASLRRHIDGLSGKDYSGLEGLRTLDFVLLFIPIEGAFIEAVRADDALYGYALAKNISLVSPSTLLATLRTVAHLWRLERRNVNATEMARVAARLHDNIALLVDELENVGSQLDKAQRAHASALRRLTEGGKGSVLLQVQSLAEMGAPTKKALPARLVDAAGGSAEQIGADPVGDVEDPGEPL